MKIVKIKIKDLFDFIGCDKANTEYPIIDREIYIRNHKDEFVKVNSLIFKNTKLIKLKFENFDFICSENHILFDENWNEVKAKHAENVLSEFGELKIIEKEDVIGEYAYDVSLDAPHIYKTPNGLFHHNTFLAIGYAIQQLALGNYERLVLCRAAVPTGKTMGFFPGDIYEKMLPWIQQMLTYAKQFAGSNVVNTWMHGEHPKIILEPMETMRGRNFENTIVIVDEAQQLEFSEIKCLSTRIGKNTKMIFCGDLKQRDIKVSGLEQFIDIVDRYEIDNIGITEFDVDDIVRSGIVRDLTIAYINDGV